MFETTDIQALPDFLFGHAQNVPAGTGCTVVIAPQGATCGVDVRGGGPATRETDLLRPENMIEKIHAVTLAGGSAFGLEASCGVMDALASRGIGFQLESLCVPIVSGACLFDLMLGENFYPDKNMGKDAAEAAFAKKAFEEGNVGAGTGASVGKLLGPAHAMKSGFGIRILRSGELVVGAFVAVNALGNIMDAEGKWLAGCRSDDNIIMDSLEALDLAVDQMSQAEAPTNTTIGVIVTNAQLTKAQATKTSSIVHDGYARAIKPVHLSNDGDTVFTFASGAVPALPDLVAVMAAEAMEGAIRRAVLNAKGAYGLPSAKDLLR